MPKHSQLFSTNAIFLDKLYQEYLNNPNSVDESWQEFFADMDAPHSVEPTPQQGGYSQKTLEDAALESVRALMLIRTYRVRGHLNADLDPLGITEQQTHTELSPAHHGFHNFDYDKPIFLNGVLGRDRASLREIISILMKTYCGKIGTEFMHIQYPDQKSWIQREIENSQGEENLTDTEKTKILDTLIEVESFEKFLNTKFPGTKRFSILGSDAVIAGLETALQEASNLGVKEVVIGMPHRGRMNVITTVMKKPYMQMMALFHGHKNHPDWIDSSGDVKYHLGMSSDRVMDNGETMHLSLTANPSHLEAVNPVAVGKVRAKQTHHCDTERKKVMAILMHGDAAFSGQGVVGETLSLSELKGYQTGGTIHIIVNNQIGFTTSPKHSRSSPYSSDVAKAVQAPIYHVNGDDPEAVAYVCKLAVEFRQKFQRDVVIDVFCYRKFGHNEGDEPMFTQPIMYKEIKQHPLVAKLYADKLEAENTLTKKDIAGIYTKFEQHFEEAFTQVDDFELKEADWLGGKWEGMRKSEKDLVNTATGVEENKLKKIGLSLAKIPTDVKINRKLERLLNNKKNAIETGEGIDWAAAESLAFGSLLVEGYSVRLSGQDSRRGTFSQRHSVLVDQNNENEHIPLNDLSEIDDTQEGYFEVIDSNLSEFAVLGFEYGYSMAEPNALVLWEAQFGDFANGAQVIIDQFIASGEVKWLRMSGLVMLLPHGYDGQGPEHSSARLERYLQLCAEDNMQVANCTTPANYFHILRRQLHRHFRKPLVLMTPKSLLRDRLAVSKLDDFTGESRFQPIIVNTPEDKVQRIVLCSGKVFFDLYREMETRGTQNIALVRVEQIYPFPEEELRAVFAEYSDADIVWCQEEPKNMGAWSFAFPRIEDIVGRKIIYAGRKDAASPATGYAEIHKQEQEKLIDEALTL